MANHYLLPGDPRLPDEQTLTLTLALTLALTLTLTLTLNRRPAAT